MIVIIAFFVVYSVVQFTGQRVSLIRYAKIIFINFYLNYIREFVIKHYNIKTVLHALNLYNAYRFRVYYSELFNVVKVRIVRQVDTIHNII